MPRASADVFAAAALEPEEQARADLYGLIGRLFYGPPDARLLEDVSSSPAAEVTEDARDIPLPDAWGRLREACRSSDPAIVRQEYDGLFVGVGKAPVTPYLSAHAEPHAPDRHLLRLRQRLAGWGLARRESAGEVEDHISGVCDVMRWLIEQRRPLADQRAFFRDFVYGGATAFCVAAQKSPSGAFYREVARFTLQFLEVEKVAFEMEMD